MKKQQKELKQYEARYRLYIKLSCLLVLGIIILIDASVKDYQAPIEVLLALVACVAGIQVKELQGLTKLTKRKKGKK